MERCEDCGRPATRARSRVDLNRRGYNLGEPGYRRAYLCSACAAAARADSCARVEALAVGAEADLGEGG